MVDDVTEARSDKRSNSRDGPCNAVQLSPQQSQLMFRSMVVHSWGEGGGGEF